MSKTEADIPTPGKKLKFEGVYQIITKTSWEQTNSNTFRNYAELDNGIVVPLLDYTETITETEKQVVVSDYWKAVNGLCYQPVERKFESKYEFEK